jgi:uncharacterized protein YdeI (BOF family)
MNKQIILFVILALVSAQVVVAGQFFLEQYLFEGESQSYEVGGYVHTITLVGVFDSQLKARFELNGETTDALGEDDRYKFSDGSVIQVRDVLPQESGEGKDLVQFNFFPAERPETVEQETETIVEQELPPEVIVEPEQEIQPAPEQEARIDLTRKKATKSWWGSFVDWLKNLFK